MPEFTKDAESNGAMSNLSLFPVSPLEPESETVEYKSSWHQDYLKSLAAFANTRGGTLRVGVRDDFTIVGWNGDARAQEDIVSRIVEILNVHPLRVEVEHHDGKPVLAITMIRAATPVSVRGRFYRRIGNTTQEVPEAERIRFLLEKTGQSWDELPCDATTADLSPSTLADFRLQARERLPMLLPSESVESILEKLRLRTSENSLKRGTYLLFGNAPHALYRSAAVQVGRFANATTILDEQLIHGNIFDQLRDTMQALRKYLLVRYEIPKTSSGRSAIEDLQRREIWEIPFDAIREAVLNALIHRDYMVHGMIQIRVYDDRMTIDNPGGLMEGLTVSHLLEDSHQSLLRNPMLAEIIYFTRLIERWGTGTIRMRDACRIDGVPDPEFTAAPFAFTVTFRRLANSTNKQPVALSKAEAAILAIAEMEKQITTRLCAERLHISRPYAWQILNKLVDRGLLEPHGEGRSRSYEMTKLQTLKS
jgi:ATP-dependent DNA helicase RecG